ncbi:MAG: hypothetical protein ACJAQT_001933 [Akkermansiaceae bacterium]|jgi:hypothetical protein
MKRLLRSTFAITLIIIGLLLGLYPALHTGWALATDPGLRTGGPTKMAFRMHHSLSNRLPDYIDERIASNIATTLEVSQIEATEWPLYGAFFYLRATEKLQRQWEPDHALAATSPKEAGRNTIEASARLLLDENHAHWVKTYWGPDYLKSPNCFYRMLVLGGLSAHHELTGSEENFPFMRTLMADMITDLDTSPHGLIDDYPHQCFPADVIAAIAMIKASAASLGEDRSEWARHALARLMQVSGNKLPPYTASSETGQASTSTRGCTNGFALPYIHEIDPALAAKLYQESTGRFWEEGHLARGWREFASDHGRDAFYFDPDSGPVLFHFGRAATGLGLGVARTYGDHKRAGALGIQFLATSFPLPTGRLIIPSLIGNRKHAPHFPEIVLMSQLAQASKNPSAKGPTPLIFWIITSTQFLIGSLLVRSGYRRLRKVI